jgi:hypothetical protein
MLGIGVVLVLIFLPFTVYALSYNGSVPLNSDTRASPGFVALLALLGTIGLIITIIGAALPQKS